MTTQRIEHVGIVVEDLAAATLFFVELGLEVQGQKRLKGDWMNRLLGCSVGGAEIRVLQTPDDHGRLELTKFDTPALPVGVGDRCIPVNTPGIRHVAFSVDDIDDAVAKLRACGAQLLGKVQSQGGYRFCYLRGPEAIIVELAERIGADPKTPKDVTPDAWKSVFAFLEQEIKFQAAAAAVTGAAAAWWLKAILTPSPAVTAAAAPVTLVPLTQSFLGRVAATLLAASACLFLMDEGRLTKRYGDLARALAKNESTEDLTKTLVRHISLPAKFAKIELKEWFDWRTALQWSPYYVGRLCLYGVAAILLGLVFKWWK